MVRREIDIDEATDRVLTELASEYQGDLGLAVADLVRAREGFEEFAEHNEVASGRALREMRERAEGDFRAGRVESWKGVKARHGL